MYRDVISYVFLTLRQVMDIFGKIYQPFKKRNQKMKRYAFRPFELERVDYIDSFMWPQPRSGHRIGADSSNFYTFGGYNPLMRPEHEIGNGFNPLLDRTFPLFQEMWRFNFASKTWHRYSNSDTLPDELVSNALLLHENLLMVYGGTGAPFGYRCSNQLHVCNVRDEQLEIKEIETTGEFPQKLYGQAIIYHNDYLYTIGGTTGSSYNCDIHRLNIHTLEWSVVYEANDNRYRIRSIDEPLGRYRHEVAFDGDNIFILGGGTARMSYDLKYIPTFNLTKLKWSTIETIKDTHFGYPGPRRCHGANQINTDGQQQVFITGGHNGSRIFDDLWRLDLKTFQWSYFPQCKLFKEIYFHASSLTPEGKLYIFGGIINDRDNNQSRTNKIVSTWLRIPKLSEISWEAVLHYNPKIILHDHDELIRAGLPKNFVYRIPPNRCKNLLKEQSC